MKRILWPTVPAMFFTSSSWGKKWESDPGYIPNICSIYVYTYIYICISSMYIYISSMYIYIYIHISYMNTENWYGSPHPSYDPQLAHRRTSLGPNFPVAVEANVVFSTQKTILDRACSWVWVPSNYIYIYTLWLFNIAMENGPFIDGLPIENCDFP